MKTAAAGLQTLYAGVVTTIADCVKIKRRDGTILAVTTHDQNLSINIDSDGVQTYSSALGFMPSQFEQSDDLRPGQSEIETAINASGITEAAIIAGLWNGATAKSFKVNWAATQPITDAIKLSSYTLGKISRGDFILKAELLDQIDGFGKTIVDYVTEKCPFNLGDTDCGVALTPTVWGTAQVIAVGDIRRPTTYNGRRFIATVAGTTHATTEPTWNTTVGGTTTDGTVTWTTYQSFVKQGTVATVASQVSFTVTGISAADAPNDWARLGTCRFTSGLNNGITKEVLDWIASTGTIKLLEAMPFTIAASDTCELTIGCDKKLIPTCRDTFNNVLRCGAFHWLPGRDKINDHS